MTDLRIIYPTDEGGVAVIVPSPNWLAENSIEALAAKDVPPITRHIPTGLFAIDEDTGESYELHDEVIEPRPYKIVSVDDIPSDRTWRAAWEYVDDQG